ncbi:MAG: hypothetical protein KJZ84_20910 [Bryobacteraceae bacterium]|nr:hypothetical protein [Bryobacteraceae bacterium]
MKRHLLDVGVLFALMWLRHKGHTAASKWFDQWGHESWATNPITELGVLRLLTIPNLTQSAVKPAGAAAVLKHFLQHPGHEFWTPDRKWPNAPGEIASRVQGCGQWRDLALLWHAMEKGASFVTFDQGLKQAAGPDWSTAIVVLKY